MYTVGRRGKIKQFETMNYRFVHSFKERMVLMSRLTFLFKIRSYAENDKEDEEELRVIAAVRGMKTMTTCTLWILSYTNVNRKSCVFLVQTVLQHIGCIESEYERVYKNMWFEKIHRDREADLLCYATTHLKKIPWTEELSRLGMGE